jgi:hypothetical protein
MIPVEISLDPHTEGDKWPGILKIGPVLVNGEAPAEKLARVRMHFRDADGNLAYRLDSEEEQGDGPILIEDEDTWEAAIPEVAVFPLKAGDHSWDMEFYEGEDETPLTFYNGTLTVLPDVTKNY